MTVKNLVAYTRPRAQVAPWVAVLATLSIVAAAAAGWLVWGQEQAGAALRQQLAVARAATAVKPAPSLSKAEVEQAKRWSELQKERDFDWTRLFNALEMAGGPDIELLEFRPDKTGSTVVLRGEAKDEAALLDFMERLAGSKALKQVFLSHRKIRKRDRLVTLVFEIKASIAGSMSP